MKSLIRPRRRVLPGFGLSLGYALTYLGLIVLLPLSTLFFQTARGGWKPFWQTATEPNVVAAFKLTFGASILAAVLNVGFGFIVAWTLVRYKFPGRRVLDALVDLPFGLPTAVSGIVLTTLLADQGWIGRYLAPLGIHAAYSQLGIVIALTFIGLPFVIRTLQPALVDLDSANEEAAASLGASRWQTFRRVILPAVLPSVLTGFALALARGLGEYGSVVFISSNIPGETQIASQLIMARLDEIDYAGAATVAVMMLACSFALLLAVNVIQWWLCRGSRAAAA